METWHIYPETLATPHGTYISIKESSKYAVYVCVCNIHIYIYTVYILCKCSTLFTSLVVPLPSRCFFASLLQLMIFHYFPYLFCSMKSPYRASYQALSCPEDLNRTTSCSKAPFTHFALHWLTKVLPQTLTPLCRLLLLLLLLDLKDPKAVPHNV